MKYIYNSVKYHGIGNDYLILDPAFNKHLPDAEDIRMLCDRHYGFGSDGLLIGPISADDENFTLQLFNPDGSEFEKSGNGLRIFARYIYDRGYSRQRKFYLLTETETMAVEILNDHDVKIHIGSPDFHSTALPATGPRRVIRNEELLVKDRIFNINCVSMGNPHCVVFFNDLSETEILDYGPLLERHHIFPRRTNVQFVKVRDRNNLEILIWERGAGYTLASGTSSCAAFAVAGAAGLCSSEVNVHMPGGELKVSMDASGSVWLEGPVKKVYEGSMEVDR